MHKTSHSATVVIALVCWLVRPPVAFGQETPDSVAVSADSAAMQADSTAALAPIPDAQEALDEQNRADLQAIFDRVPALAGVELTVAAGVVTLTGQVPDANAADRAAELAASREGVVYVDDSGLESLAAAARIEDVSSRLGDQLRSFMQMLPLIGIAALIVAIFCGLAVGLGRLSFRRGVSTRSPFLGALIQRLVQFTLVVLGLVIALELLDATALVGAVVGTAGLAGLALGFAFKDIAENYLAGVILSLRQPFAKNDLIVVAGQEGKVVRLTGRETILMTPDGNHVQIPNAIVFREPMTNFSRNPFRRFTVEVGVAAATILSDALDIGLRVLAEMNGVVDQPEPEAIVRELGDSTVLLQFMGWVDQRQADYLRVRSEAIRLLKVNLEDAGIELPEPEYRVHLPDMRERKALVPDAEQARSAGSAGRSKDGEGVARSALEGAQRDVSVDTTLDAQIEADRRVAGEEDLLEADGGDRSR